MVVLGIDAAWTERGSSGVALLKCTQRRRHVLKSGTATSGLPLPGVTRQSIRPRKTDFAKKMDARVKPGHDGGGTHP
jgi:hypothetical protein